MAKSQSKVKVRIDLPTEVALQAIQSFSGSSGQVCTKFGWAEHPDAGATEVAAKPGESRKQSFTFSNDQILLDSFRAGFLSSELFTLPNGVNEFDLIKIDDYYYFASDDQTTTRLRMASSVPDLSLATPYTPVANLRFPSIQFDGSYWHLWGSNISGIGEHYTSTSFTGSYTLRDTLPVGFHDLHVRQLSNGLYYCAYKDANVSPRKIGLLVAKTPYGPWTNLGYCFDDVPPSVVRSGEEADPAIFEADDQCYITYAAYDGLLTQRPAIALLDPNTGKARHESVVLVNPLLPWQQANGQKKLFNPVFLREGSQPDRIYYSQNVSATGIPAGWGYIEAGLPPNDHRRNSDLLRVDFEDANLDVACGIPAEIHGTASISSSGLEVTTGIGGAYGLVNISDITDFSFLIDFTVAVLPAPGNYSLLFRASTWNNGTQPIVGLWITNTHKLYSEIRKPGNVGSSTPIWTTTLSTGERYRAVITRKGMAVTGYLNGAVDMTGNFDGGLPGLQEWACSNQRGVSAAASQQYTGAVHRILMTASSLCALDA